MRELTKRTAFPFLLILFAAVVTGPSPARAEAEETPDGVVEEWVRRIKAGGAVYPGGRQRDRVTRAPEAYLRALVGAFADENPRVGRGLWRIAALAPAGSGVKVLWPALEDDRPFVREFAALALGGMKAEKSVPGLTTAFRSGKLSLESMTAALGDMGGDAAEEALIGLASSYAPERRVAAIETLAAYPSERVRKVLRAKLEDRNPTVRAAALRTLGAVGGPDDAAAVANGLRDDDESPRLAAIGALGRLGGEEARSALMLHFTAKQGERLEALEAAVALGEAVTPGPATFATRLLDDEDPDIRRRAARLVAMEPGSVGALIAVIGRESDPDTALSIAGRAVDGGAEGVVDPIVGLLERLPDRRVEILALLDRAGDEGLADRLRSLEPLSDEPAGGPLFWLAFHGDASDVERALAMAQEHPRRPDLVADAYFLVVTLGGKGAIDGLIRSAHRLPTEDRIVVTEGPVRPGLRDLHMRVVRLLTGRVFGYDPSRPAGENRDALRRALKWWLSSGRKDGADWTEGAEAEARKQAGSSQPGRREAALDLLARLGRRDDVAKAMTGDDAIANRVRAARLLVEDGDTRGAAWLVEHFADETLVDWTPFIEAPRPTRLEAARALWRAANRAGEYRAMPVGGEWLRDLVLDEATAWRAWWAEEGAKGPIAWFEEGCRRRGVVLGEDEARRDALLDILGGDHPRYLKENALAVLRAVTGDSIVPIPIEDLEIFAPGETHPVFEALSRRWRAKLRRD